MSSRQQIGSDAPTAAGLRGRDEVDFLWADPRLILEVDGYAYHGDRAAFERDRRRGLALVAAEYRVIRVTWRQIVEEPFLVVATVAGRSTRAPGEAAPLTSISPNARSAHE